jgi:hypothetical protein
MKLRPIVKVLPPVPVRLKLPGDLHATLSRYAEFYRHEHGAGIEVPELVVEMVRAFLATDRDFRAWRRNGQGPQGTPTGVGRNDGVSVGGGR